MTVSCGTHGTVGEMENGTPQPKEENREGPGYCICSSARCCIEEVRERSASLSCCEHRPETRAPDEMM